MRKTLPLAAAVAVALSLGGASVALAQDSTATGPDTAGCRDATTAATNAKATLDAKAALDAAEGKVGPAHDALVLALEKIGKAGATRSVLVDWVAAKEKALEGLKGKPLAEAQEALALAKDALAKFDAHATAEAEAVKARKAFQKAGGQKALVQVAVDGGLTVLLAAQDKACAKPTPTPTATPTTSPTPTSTPTPTPTPPAGFVDDFTQVGPDDIPVGGVDTGA